MERKQVLISLSGGLDSMVLLARLIASGVLDVRAVGFKYSSKHNDLENLAALSIANHFKVPFKIIDLSHVFTDFKSDLLKTGGPIPEGHYEAKSMERTVVPGRNIIFASICAGLSWSLNCSEVYLGVHAGDHAIYPDCRPEFMKSMEQAIRKGTDYKVELCTPFLLVDKKVIVREGLQLHAPFHLTRTCYKEQHIACGRCGSCQERLAAFSANNAHDPIDYASRAILPRDVLAL